MLDSIPPSCNSLCGAIHVFLRFERWPFTPRMGEAVKVAGSSPGWYLGSVRQRDSLVFPLCYAGGASAVRYYLQHRYFRGLFLRKKKKKDLNTQRKLE